MSTNSNYTIIWGIVPDNDEYPQIQFCQEKDTKKALLVINGGIIQNQNVKQGSGSYSIEQLTSGYEEPISFELKNPSSPDNNKTYIRGVTGETAVLFGDWNRNEANYSIVAGDGNVYDNTSKGRGLIVGRYNHSQAEDGITGGSQNYTKSARCVVAGNLNKVAEGCYDSAMFGSQNKINSNNPNTFVSGLGNIVQENQMFVFMGGGRNNTAESYCQAVFGCFTKANPDALFKVGAGEEPTAENGWRTIRRNAFEILKDGSVVVEKSPLKNNDVLRWQEYIKLKTAIENLGGTVE